MDEQDDDVIVIVVDEDNQCNSEEELQQLLSPSQIKSEPIFSAEDDEFQELKELLEKHGEYIKTEALDEYDDLDEYMPDEDTLVSSDDEDSNQKTRRRLYPTEWKSYVQELREANSKYEDDLELINAIVNHMHSVKAPRLFGVYSPTDDGKFICLVCSSEKPTIGEIERHYLAQHGPRYLSCFACGADFRCTTNLYKHEKRCQAPDAKLVLKARAMYIGNKARGRKTVVETGKRFQCDLCPASYVAKVSLIAHKRMHRAERPYQCDMCTRAYTSKSVLAKHRWTHSEANFVCDHCGRTFKYKTALASHVYTHFPPRFPCQECPKKFTYKSALLLHVHHIHRRLPPPCACQLCPKRFGRMWALKDHMKKVHGMQLMTRRMFFKQLPQMSKIDIEQAKIVLRSEVPILHPSDMPLCLMNENPDNFELDSESGRFLKVKSKRGRKPKVAKQAVKHEEEAPVTDEEIVVHNEVQYEEVPLEANGDHVEETEEVVEEVTIAKEGENVDEEPCLRIVVLDDVDVDFAAISLQYDLSDYANKGRSIIVVENGKIKDLNDEEYKEIEEKIKSD